FGAAGMGISGDTAGGVNFHIFEFGPAKIFCMKLQTLFSFLLIPLLAVSCSNNDQEPKITPEHNPLITKISTDVFGYGGAYFFEYDSAQRLTKKIGGFLGV